MRSFWKVAAFRLTGSIRIQSGRRALRCFQNELHHFIILNLKWYYLLDVFSVQDIDRYRNIMAFRVCRANGTGRGRETHNSL